MKPSVAHISSTFQWPINLTHYDRMDRLTSLEQEALSTLVHATSPVSTRAIHARDQLVRLLTPLHDVLLVTQAPVMSIQESGYE